MSKACFQILNALLMKPSSVGTPPYNLPPELGVWTSVGQVHSLLAGNDINDAFTLDVK
jgi:hypothetical protein